MVAGGLTVDRITASKHVNARNGVNVVGGLTVDNLVVKKTTTTLYSQDVLIKDKKIDLVLM